MGRLGEEALCNDEGGSEGDWVSWRDIVDTLVSSVVVVKVCLESKARDFLSA